MKSAQSMPVLFIGHGSPMNSVEDNAYTRAWQELGAVLPVPRAILSISAHWLTEGTYVYGEDHPQTLHDFFGFPQNLYDITYPAPGAPEIAETIRTNVHITPIETDAAWGLDHGTWSVLYRMYPNAQIPTLQLSIDITKPFAFHAALGKELAFLRSEGVLIIGSGNIVHHLGLLDFRSPHTAYPWAAAFDTAVAEHIRNRQFAPLITPSVIPHHELAIPTPDHYIPLLYILGALHDDDHISFPVEGITFGSISMRAVLGSSI